MANPGGVLLVQCAMKWVHESEFGRKIIKKMKCVIVSNNYLMFKPAIDYDTVSVIIEEVKQLHIIAFNENIACDLLLVVQCNIFMTQIAWDAFELWN